MGALAPFTPADPSRLPALLALLVGVLGAGLALGRVRSRRVARAGAWALVVAAAGLAERLTAAEPPGVRMLAICGAVLYAMKAVVSIEERCVRLSPLRWLAFAALWPGMRPEPFAGLGQGRLHGAGALIARGAVRAAAGVALLLGARVVFAATGSHALAAAPLLAGLSLAFHFGALKALAGAFRLAGADVGPLFRAPLRARTLAEFWGRRWNLAFSEMTATAVYRPLGAVAGRPVALLASFLVSGALHELAISVPVRAGHGLPLLYFALHGALVLAERALEARDRPIDERSWLGRAWTVAWLAAPLPLVFHPPFLQGVLFPLLGP